MSLFDLGGMTAIVTGSSRGIGRAIAIEMARAGARVVVSSRKLEACAAVVETIRGEGHEAIAVACNIGDLGQLETLVAETRAAFGPVDILVANAAVNPYFGSLAAITDEAFDRIMHSNIRSNLRLASLVQPDMAAKGDGSIIIISSIAGLKGSRTIGAYGISKAGDMQLARNLALEWGKQGIRVNTIAPGLVKTDFAKALWDNPPMLKATLEAAPLGRIGEPEDIAGAAIFLASRAGRFVTGQTLVVDGGVTIGGAF
jgi:NAD(P)-dependent dehydrogenase (short-subunit alcohol dehydrogenase family)